MATRVSFQLPNMDDPIQNSQGVPIPFDFTANPVNINGDLGLEQMTGTLDFIQSIYIDNSLNTKSFVITFSGLAYQINVKAGRQGIWPVVIANGRASWTAVSTNAGIIVNTIMFNRAMPYFYWDV